MMRANEQPPGPAYSANTIWWAVGATDSWPTRRELLFAAVKANCGSARLMTVGVAGAYDLHSGFRRIVVVATTWRSARVCKRIAAAKGDVVGVLTLAPTLLSPTSSCGRAPTGRRSAMTTNA